MAYLGKTPSQATRQRYYFTASGSETSVSGADDNSNTLVFTDGNYIDVILNGSTLVAGTDYNTTTANTVSGLAALSASDIIEIVVYDTFSVFGGNVNGDFNFGDNNKAIFGAGNDLQIYHQGSHSFVEDTGTGNLYLATNGTSVRITKGPQNAENMAAFNVDGSAILYYDNVAKIATTATGIDVTGVIEFGDSHTIGDDGNDNLAINSSAGENIILGPAGGVVNLADDKKLTFGQGQDLQIYHDGTNSYIDDAGTGRIYIRASDQLRLQASDGENYALFAANGAAQFYYDNAQKLATTASGISVTGAISSNKGSAGTLATFTDGVNSNFIVETSSLLTTIGNGGGSASLAFKANNSEKMRLTSAGLLGLGSTSPSQKLTVEGTANNQNSEIKITASGVASGYLGANSDGLNIGTDSYNIVFKTSVTGGGSVGATGSEKARITTAGDVLIGTTNIGIGNLGWSFRRNNASFVTTDNNPSLVVKRGSNTGTAIEFVGPNSNSVLGNISVSTTAVSFNTTSDYRLKENVTAITSATDRLNQLNPVRFNFIADADTTVDGFLAHEAQAVVPEAVTGTHNEVDDDGDAVMQGIDQSKLVPLLTAALQEALTKIEQLETRITALEA
jgi:hypothetical protein